MLERLVRTQGLVPLIGHAISIPVSCFATIYRKTRVHQGEVLKRSLLTVVVSINVTVV